MRKEPHLEMGPYEGPQEVQLLRQIAAHVELLQLERGGRYRFCMHRNILWRIQVEPHLQVLHLLASRVQPSLSAIPSSLIQSAFCSVIYLAVYLSGHETHMLTRA